MKSLFKIVVLIFCFAAFSNDIQAQGYEPAPGFTQLNFGVGASAYGLPVYLGMDFGVSDKITIGPRVSYRSYTDRFGFFGNSYNIRYSVTNLSFRGDYHYGSHISALPSELDLYGGLSLGYTIWTDNYDGPDGYDVHTSGVFLAIQAGARWYFHEKWAANAEVSGGSLSGLEIGLSYKF